MRKAFSLVEVMIATVIIAIVGLGILQMSTRHQKMDGYIEQKGRIANYLSIAAFHHDTQFNKLEKSPLDYLKNDYTIDHPEIKKLLDDDRFYYIEQESGTIDFGESADPEEEERIDTTRNVKQIVVYRGTIRQGDNAVSFFFLKQ